jgi:hypothetical protein
VDEVQLIHEGGEVVELVGSLFRFSEVQVTLVCRIPAMICPSISGGVCRDFSAVHKILALAHSGDKVQRYYSICCFARLYLEVHVSVLIKTADVP